MNARCAPHRLLGWELGAAGRTLTTADKAKAINDDRATLLQGIGGAVILLGALHLPPAPAWR